MAKDKQVHRESSNGSSKGKQVLTGASSNVSSRGKQVLIGESSNGSSKGKQVLIGESSNGSSKGQQVLIGESSNGSSKGKQVLSGESSNGSRGKQIFEGEPSNASKGKQILNASNSLRLFLLAHIMYSTANKLNKNDYTSKDNVINPDAVSTVQNTKHKTMDIESGDTVQTTSHSRTRQANHRSSKFWVCLRWSFFIICFILEVISVVLEELPSQKNPIYALCGMVVSIITLIFCFAELVWKGKMEKVTWKRRGKIYWFYDPNNKRFGTFPDIFGLIFGVLEFITSTVTYALYIRGKNNPIELPFCSIVFAILLLCSNYPIDQDDDDDDL